MGDSTDDKCPRPTLDKAREGRLDVALVASFRDNDLQPKSTRGRDKVSLFIVSPRTAGKIRDCGGLGHHRVQ